MLSANDSLSRKGAWWGLGRGMGSRGKGGEGGRARGGGWVGQVIIHIGCWPPWSYKRHNV